MMMSLLGLTEKRDARGELLAPRILVVDDEIDIRNAVKTVLQATLKAKVFLAGSGAEGLELLKREQVDLIMTDFKMPGMNGLEFMEQARRVDSHVPFVLITAFERELIEALGGIGEAEAILTKPLSPRPLVQTVQKILLEGHA